MCRVVVALGREYFYEQLRYHEKRFARVRKDKRAYRKIIPKCEFFRRNAPLFARVVLFDKDKRTFEVKPLKIEEEEGRGIKEPFVGVPYGYLPTLPPKRSDEEEQEDNEDIEEDVASRRKEFARYYLSLHSEQA
jgi:hypothetical protein